MKGPLTWNSLLVLLLMVMAGKAPGQLFDLMVPYSLEENSSLAPGYIFLSPHSASPTHSRPSNLMLLDSAGYPVWFAPLDAWNGTSYSNTYPTDFKLLPNGQFAFWADLGSRQWYFLDRNFRLVDSAACIGYSTTNSHDIAISPDGNLCLICDTALVMDASHLQTANGQSGSNVCVVSGHIIQEIDGQGQVVSEWNTLDHLPLEDIGSEHWNNPSFMDHSHVNSVRFDRAGEVLLSSRHLNEVTAYHRSSGALSWRLGGKGNAFQLIGDSVFFNAQHDARFASNGNLYLFDNGSEGASHVARYLEYELDTVQQTARLVRELRHPGEFRSIAMGNAIRLDNGHVIVDWGWPDPRENTFEITEFDAEGRVALSLDFEDPYLSYRVSKQELPWQLERTAINCDPVARTLSGPEGHGTYWWANGDSTRTIEVSSPGFYQLWVDQGIGYLSSEVVRVTDLDDVCADFREDGGAPALLVFPVPAEAQLEIVWSGQGQRNWELEIFDFAGRSVWSDEALDAPVQLDISSWRPGWYLIRATGAETVFQRKIWKP